MSLRANDCAEIKEYEYAELFIQLPGDWPYADMGSPDYGWPVYWLRSLAAFPHEQGTWLGGPVVIYDDDPGGVIAPNVKFTSMLVMAERRFTSNEGKLVQLFRLTPLYPEERELHEKEGIAALMRAFDQHGVPFVVDLRRKNVAR